jgi:hypothetical protein
MPAYFAQTVSADRWPNGIHLLAFDAQLQGALDIAKRQNLSAAVTSVDARPWEPARPVRPTR